MDGPFVPHNLISTQESPVPLLKFQMAPDLKFFVLWVHERNPDILLFSLKIPVNEPLPGSPTGPLWREIPVYRAFCIYLENFIKFL
jgi:hypothetical protein